MSIDSVGSTPSVRETRPTTIAGTVSFPGGVGVEVSHNLTDRVALSAEASSWLLVSDISAQVKLYPVAGEHAGLYVSAGPHLAVVPLVSALDGSGSSSMLFPGLGGEIGGEYRHESGFTISGGVGGMVVHQLNSNNTAVVPTAQLRLGYSF